jgi:Arc/MetJ family transcription regulator
MCHLNRCYVAQCGWAWLGEADCWQLFRLPVGLPVAAQPSLLSFGCGTGAASLLRERPERVVYLMACARYTDGMKHLVDVDETLLAQARATLGTNTIKDTVNEALRRAADRKRAELDAAMDELADLVRTLPVQDRASAW